MLFTRRRVVLTAAVAGAVFGADKVLEILPAAHAQVGNGTSPLNPKGLKFYRFKVGDIEVTTVFDGAIVRDMSPTFIRNATVDELKASLAAAGLPNEKIPNVYTVTIVKIGDRHIMFDSGNGAGMGNPNVGFLAENMKAAGIDPAKLSTIVVTHFHPDHIYGLMTKENAQIYGETQIVVPEAEYKYWADAGVIATLHESRVGIAKRVQATMPSWKNLKQIASDAEAVPGVKAVATFGHSPGHTSYLVSSGNQQMMVLGDLTNIPAVNLKNPGWHIFFDQDPQMAEATRRRIFDRVVADRIIVTGYHWGMPGAGTIAKDGNGYVLQPVA